MGFATEHTDITASVIVPMMQKCALAFDRFFFWYQDSAREESVGRMGDADQACIWARISGRGKAWLGVVFRRRTCDALDVTDCDLGRQAFATMSAPGS